MTRPNFNNNKGFILIVCYMVIAVLVILAISFAARSIGEQRVAQKEKDSIRAFWLAEAGLDRAISELPNTPLSYQLDPGRYYTETTPLDSNRFLIISKGGMPDTDETVPNNIIRSIRAIVEQPENDADPSVVTSAITTDGDVVIKGGADVNGDIDDNSIFNLEEIFRISKETLRDNTTNYYTNPPNNISPVNYITWIDIDASEELHISDNNWEGSGILVVNGDLKITGGDFKGIIWVTGTLEMTSGNPHIEGAIFVEGGAETILTGNAHVEHDTEAINDAFDYLPSNLPPHIISWQEVY